MIGHHTHDTHGLTERWFDVPNWEEEAPRPQSAIEYDRKGGVQKDMNFQQQKEYWKKKNAQFKSLGESRKNGKRNDARRKAAQQIIDRK